MNLHKISFIILTYNKQYIITVISYSSNFKKARPARAGDKYKRAMRN